MRKTFAYILLFIVLINCICYAHPGKTDKNGGHYVSGTGEYHYHHGYSAHYHTGGVCPYDFEDKTDHSSKEQSSSSGSYGKSYYTVPEQKETQTEVNSSKEEKEKTITDIILEIVVCIIMLIIAVMTLPMILMIVAAIAISFASPFIELYKSIKNKISQRHSKAHKNKKHYIEPILNIYHNIIPQGFALTKDLYPINLNNNYNNSKYYVYVTHSGSCYHKKECAYRRSNSISGLHIYEAERRYYSPCSVCKPKIPYDAWYERIKEIAIKDAELYKELEANPDKLQEYLVNRIIQETKKKIPGIVFEEIGWTNWDKGILNSDEQLARYERAKIENIRIENYDNKTGTAIIKGNTGYTYTVNKYGCTCQDFKFNSKQKAPCKHMYFLAVKLYETKNNSADKG